MKNKKILEIGLGFVFLYCLSSYAQGIDPKQEGAFVYNIVKFID